VGRLAIYQGEELLEEFDLARAVIALGRHPENDIVLDDRTLSRFHARIERRRDQFVIVDLGAQNGVMLNGVRIEREQPLETGDRLELGRYTAVFDYPLTTTAGLGEVVPPPRTTLDQDRPQKRPAPIAPPEEEEVEIDFGLDDEDDDPALETNNHARAGLDDGFSAPSSAVDYMPPQPALVLLFNGMEVSKHPVKANKLTIGRSKQCDVVISLLGLSRKHAEIAVTDEGVVVCDLGSQNGTWVNNERIEGRRVLRHGDLLNFYDYGVLFLEDGEADVGFPGAGFQLPPLTGGPDDLSQRATKQGDGPMTSPPRLRQPTQRGDALSELPATGRPGHKSPIAEETDLGARRPPPKNKRDRPEHRLDMDLGEGSYLGDEFEEGASKDRPEKERDDSLLDAFDDDSAWGSEKPSDGTDLIAGVPDISRGANDEDIEAEAAFSAAAQQEFIEGATDGDISKLANHTMAEQMGALWPSDRDLDQVLAKSNDSALYTLEVVVNGRPYTQMPLSQAVTRVGTDARCEFSLPRNSGLRPWHCTFLLLGGATMIARASRKGEVELRGSQVDTAVLKAGDSIMLGKVEIRIRGSDR
jgi:pSer/pThr/pTyr-binding forkhead associated (FHA) protein